MMNDPHTMPMVLATVLLLVRRSAVHGQSP
jgi:hypothetical protein